MKIFEEEQIDLRNRVQKELERKYINLYISL